MSYFGFINYPLNGSDYYITYYSHPEDKEEPNTYIQLNVSRQLDVSSWNMNSRKSSVIEVSLVHLHGCEV